MVYTMTETQLRKLLNVWKKRLGLADWHIILSIEACDDEYSYMEVNRSIEYKRSELIVQPWLLGIGKPPKDILIKLDKQWPTFIEETLVHELLHLLVTGMSIIVKDDIDGFLHRDVYAQVWKSFHHAEERMVDDLAVSLVRAFNSI